MPRFLVLPTLPCWSLKRSIAVAQKRVTTLRHKAMLGKLQTATRNEELAAVQAQEKLGKLAAAARVQEAQAVQPEALGETEQVARVEGRPGTPA